MKKIIMIVKLMHRAEIKGLAVRRGRQRDLFGNLGDLEEVYRVENDGETVSLFHYGTLTAKVDLKALRLVEIYGESRSDFESINTFLDELGFRNFRFGYRPLNGGFYLSTTDQDGKHKETFLDEQGEEAVLIDFNNVQI